MRWTKILAVLAIAALAGCSQPTGNYVAVTGITISATAVTLTVGSQYQLHATLFPWNASNQLLLWGTDAPETAKVSGGTVTAISSLPPGIATITVYSGENGSIFATCKIMVQ